MATLADSAEKPSNPAQAESREADGASGVHPDGDDGVLEAIAVHQKHLSDWTLRTNAGKVFDLSACARTTDTWVDSLRDELIPCTWPSGKRIEHPRILLTFAVLRHDVLGHFRPRRNQHGLLWEVGLNPAAMLHRTDVQTASVLLHELLHVCEEVAGRPARGRHNYHSSSFRAVAETLGIPCSRYGRETGVVRGSLFSSWATRHGLSFGDCSFLRDAAPDEDRVAVAKAKRLPWECNCGFKVWVPRAQVLNAKCRSCRAEFRRAS